MRVAGVLFAALCLVTLLADPALAERRVALVIGNGAYKDAPLKNPVNDARDMAAALKGLGFEVILRENASLRQMEDALDQFWAGIRQGGTGLFFFAGHGVQVKGVNYLVPVDARILVEQDVKSACLDAGRVLGRMENAGNGLNIILLDACRNNPFARSWRSAEAGLAKMDAPTGTLIGYATAPDSVAADGGGKNGVYTGHLLRFMRTPGLKVEDVLKQVRIAVLNETGRKQTPWESSSLTGDFYFNPQGTPGAQAALLPAIPAKFDAKAEKQRLADEAARLKRDKVELAQLQALQARKEQLEAERQQVEQAKLLALAARPKAGPKQIPQAAAAPAASSHAAQFALLARAGQAEAREHFERAVQSNPGDAEARAGLAIALVFSGKEADAKYQVQRLAESGAQTANARLAQGLLLGLEKSADASQQFSRAAEAGADRALLLLCRAAAAERRLEYDEGQGLMREYAALVPEAERGAYPRQLARAVDLLGRFVGRYALTQGQNSSQSVLMFEFSIKDGQLFGVPNGGGSATLPVSITNIRLQGKTLSFRYNYQLVVFGFASDGYTDFSGELAGDLSLILFKAVTHDGATREVRFVRVRLPDAR